MSASDIEKEHEQEDFMYWVMRYRYQNAIQCEIPGCKALSTCMTHNFNNVPVKRPTYNEQMTQPDNLKIEAGKWGYIHVCGKHWNEVRHKYWDRFKQLYGKMNVMNIENTGTTWENLLDKKPLEK